MSPTLHVDVASRSPPVIRLIVNASACDVPAMTDTGAYTEHGQRDVALAVEILHGGRLRRIRDRDLPTAAPSALSDALREIAALAARAESRDPRVREEARAELTAFRERFAAAPNPLDALLGKVAAALRDPPPGYATSLPD